MISFFFKYENCEMGVKSNFIILTSDNVSWKRKRFLKTNENPKVIQREGKESVNCRRGHEVWKNILRNGRRGQSKVTAGKEPDKLTCLFEYRDFFVKMRAHICLWSATWQPRIRSESKWDDKVAETPVSLISRREQGWERTRGGGKLSPSPSSLDKKACLDFLVKVSRAWQWSRCPLWSSEGQQGDDTRGREPRGDPWAPRPAGRPGFADTAQELMGENLLSSRDFLNWHFFYPETGQNKRWNRYFQGVFFFFSFHTPSPPLGAL